MCSCPESRAKEISSNRGERLIGRNEGWGDSAGYHGYAWGGMCPAPCGESVRSESGAVRHREESLTLCHPGSSASRITSTNSLIDLVIRSASSSLYTDPERNDFLQALSSRFLFVPLAIHPGVFFCIALFLSPVVNRLVCFCDDFLHHPW